MGWNDTKHEGRYATWNNRHILDTGMMNNSGEICQDSVNRTRSYRASVFLNIHPRALTTVVVGGREFRLPYVVDGYCADFDRYWDLWCEQYGASVDFAQLDIVDGGHLETILIECFEKYKYILTPGNCVWLDSVVFDIEIVEGLR